MIEYYRLSDEEVPPVQPKDSHDRLLVVGELKQHHMNFEEVILLFCQHYRKLCT